MPAGDPGARIRRHRGNRRPRDGPLGQAGRRLLRLRQRGLDEGDRDPAGSLERRLLLDRGGDGHPAHLLPAGGGREGGAAGRRRRREGRGVLPGLHEREGDRGSGLCAVEGRARRDRGDRRPRRARPRAGKRATRRRRRPQQHELPHRPSLRSLGGAGVREPGPVRRVSAPGRARDARPQRLHQHRSEIRGPPGEVPRAHRRGSPAGAGCGRRRPRPPHLRVREAHRRDTRLAHGFDRRAQGEQPVEALRLHDEGAGPRLAGLLRRGGPRRAAPDHRLAPLRGRRHLGAGRKGVPRDLEGLPRLPRGGPRLHAAPARASPTSISTSTARSSRARSSPATAGSAPSPPRTPASGSRWAAST